MGERALDSPHQAHAHRRSILGYNPLPAGGTVGERIVVHRRSRDFTQKEFARKLGVDPSTLARWERGEREPRGRSASALDATMGAGLRPDRAEAYRNAAAAVKHDRRIGTHPRKTFKHSKLNREALQGALITLALVFDIPVLRSAGPFESARLILYTGRQLRRLQERSRTVRATAEVLLRRYHSLSGRPQGQGKAALAEQHREINADGLQAGLKCTRKLERSPMPGRM